MAKTAPYFPFYVDDWLSNELIFEMSLECEGAYIRLLAAMWKRGGYIPDKQNWCCNILRCKPSKWKKIRSILLDSGVIQVDQEMIFNPRLNEELKLFFKKSEKSRENVNKRWNKHSESDTKKTNEINETNDTPVIPSQYHTDTDTDTDTELIKPSSKKKNFNEDDRITAGYIFEKIKKLNPSSKSPDFDSWSETIRLMRERDNRKHREICELFNWANSDHFWKSNILSPRKLREKWDQLLIRKNQGGNYEQSQRKLSIIEQVELANKIEPAEFSEEPPGWIDSTSDD